LGNTPPPRLRAGPIVVAVGSAVGVRPEAETPPGPVVERGGRPVSSPGSIPPRRMGETDGLGDTVWLPGSVDGVGLDVTVARRVAVGVWVRVSSTVVADGVAVTTVG
jgi:hypothetical protein